MKNWKTYTLIMDENDRVKCAIDCEGNRCGVYIRAIGDTGSRPTYWNCAGEYTRKEAYTRFRSGRLIFK